MSRSRGVSKSLSVGNSDDERRPVSAKTLRLFVTETTDAAASAGSTDAPTPVTVKNPRWLANREKEAQCEALRDKIIRLLDDIEAEEAKDRPARKKSWLRAKRLELRRISLRQAEEIAAGEAFFRRTRRKLRKAQRRRRDQVDGAEGDSVGESESDVGNGDPAASESSEEEQGKKKKKMKQSKRNEEGKELSDDGTFNLSPTGRIARPNPRVKLNESEEQQKDKKVLKSLEKLNRVVRFPLESGYKLGRLISKRRDKARQRPRSNSGSRDSGESVNRDIDHWGSRVGSGPRPTAESDSENFNADSGARVRVIIDGKSGEVEGGGNNAVSRRVRDGQRGRADSSSSSSLEDIPVLQESVGKKIRDRLAVRRGGSGRPKSGGSSGSANDLSGDSARQSDRGKKNKKKPKEKKKKEKKGKAKADVESEDGSSSEARHQGTTKSGGQLRNSASLKKSSLPEQGDPLQFVELEDGP